jgi:hypothetical protein
MNRFTPAFFDRMEIRDTVAGGFVISPAKASVRSRGYSKKGYRPEKKPGVIWRSPLSERGPF